MSTQQPQGAERRQFARIKKNYIIRFVDKSSPSQNYEVSQIENISKGGLCFSARAPFKEGITLLIEIHTPFLSESILVDGLVLQSREKVKGMIYEIRVRFVDVPSEVLVILEKIEQYHNSGKL